MEERVRFQILGPMRLRVGPNEISINSIRDRIFLASLILNVGEPVPSAYLVDTIWGDQPPRDARGQLHGCVWRLRKLLAKAGGSRLLIATDPAGYRLAADPSDIDLREFRRLRDAARHAEADGDRGVAGQRYRAALTLWRGPALAEIESEVIQRSANALDEEHIRAVEECYEVELADGKADELIPELTELVRQHPYREKLHGALMLALYRAGRQSDALTAYRNIRQTLLEELGAEPGSGLQELHRGILNQDSSLDVRPRQPTQQPPAIQMEFQPSTPRTLPPDISDFVGREKEVALMLDTLTRGDGRGAPVVVVTGPAGVGKTALTVRVAHELRQTYQDGQLYVDLHGFDAERPLEPFEVLGRFLRSLGVDGGAMPQTLDERAELYRNLIADRAVLITLDNAASDSQVAPLVPADDSCGVIINSRARLGTAFGSLTFNLATIDHAGAYAMLARIVGHERIGSEPDAVGELIRLCDFLPLAVRVAAGRLATRPHWSISRLVGHLLDERRRLDHLAHGSLDVRASITLSYSSLSDNARALLRRLGNLGLPEVTSWVAAALLDSSIPEADDVLEELFDAQLVDPIGQGAAAHVRYRLHDLVRLVAKERADLDEPPASAGAAVARVLGGWLYVAEAAHRQVFGGNYENVHATAPRWVVQEDVLETLLVDQMRWLDREYDAIAAMIRRAARDGHFGYCWGIASTVSRLVEVRGVYDGWHDLLTEVRTAVGAVDELGGAVATFRLGVISADLNQNDEAEQHFRNAVALFVHTEDHHGEALATAYLAMTHRRAGRRGEALQGYAAALPALREHNDHGATAFVLRCMGQVYMENGDLDQADKYFRLALSASRDGRSDRSMAQVLFYQGMLELRRHRYASAESLFQEVLRLVRGIGDRFGEAQALRGLGLCHRGQGDTNKARELLRGALRLIHQPRATVIEARITHDLTDLEAAHVPAATVAAE